MSAIKPSLACPRSVQLLSRLADFSQIRQHCVLWVNPRYIFTCIYPNLWEMHPEATSPSAGA